MEPKKLYTDFSYTSKMNNNDSPPCKHFTLRGYVAAMRQKDLRGIGTQQPLPPLVVQRFRSWSCNVCRGENDFHVGDRSDQRACCNGIQESLTHRRVPARKEIDINKLIDLTGDSDDSESHDLPINEEEKNDAEVAVNGITDLDPGLENDLNHPVSNAGSPDMCPSPIQELHANERGFEGNVESDAELDISNLNKSCSKVADKGKLIYEDNQCLRELRKSCKLTRKAVVITEKDIVPEHTAEQFPQEPVAEDNAHAGNSDKNGENENDVQDLHQKKHAGKSSKKYKRMRLLREILDEEPRPTKIRGGRLASKSVDSQRQKTIMDKVVGEGDTKNLEKKGPRGRKRKLVLEEDEDEENIILSQVIERVNEVSNMPTYIVTPLAQIPPNEEGLGEGLHFSSNSSPQTLPRPNQEAQRGETDSAEERIFPSTSAFSREGKGVCTEEIDEATREQNELEALDALLQISQNKMLNVEPEPQIKQWKEIDFDLNLPYHDHSTDPQMLNEQIGPGLSFDLNVAAGGSDPILQKLNPGECSKTKTDIIGSSQTYSSLKDKSSENSHAPAMFGGNFNGPSASVWLDQKEEEETPEQHCGGTRSTAVSLSNNIPARFCGMNRNPADFSPIEPGNPYMCEKKDEVRKKVGGEKRCGSSPKQNKKPKKP